ncbi:MAG: hypothetical protein IK151_07275 [Erysipelotrichaceae bacterium]|nr:hypothetical protein [Erysipelotrichaceae bacterium]
MQKEIFRKKSIERISSPEELNNYLRVTNPNIWVLLVAVILLLGGLMVWASVGTLETRANGIATVKSNELTVTVSGSKAENITEGMEVEINGNRAVLNKVDTDEYGRAIGSAIMNVPDGKYEAEVIIESIKPIKFLIK